MADQQAPGTPGGWWGLLYFLAVTAITVGADYLRRVMPPARRRDHDDDEEEERPRHGNHSHDDED